MADDDPGPDDELEPIEAPYWKRRQWEYAESRPTYDLEPVGDLF